MTSESAKLLKTLPENNLGPHWFAPKSRRGFSSLLHSSSDSTFASWHCNLRNPASVSRSYKLAFLAAHTTNINGLSPTQWIKVCCFGFQLSTTFRIYNAAGTLRRDVATDPHGMPAASRENCSCPGRRTGK